MATKTKMSLRNNRALIDTYNNYGYGGGSGVEVNEKTMGEHEKDRLDLVEATDAHHDAGSVDDGSIPIQLIIAALLLLSIMAMLVVARMYVCAML